MNWRNFRKKLEKFMKKLFYVPILAALLVLNVIFLLGFANETDSEDGYFNGEGLSFDIQIESSGKVSQPEEEVLVESPVIKLYLTDENRVVELDIDEYITGVLMGEMYSSSPKEALKAMAVSARTYTLYMADKNKGKSYHVTSDASISQAFVKKNSDNMKQYDIMKEAVQETSGEVITYDGEIICALYHASSYKRTESCKNVFVESLPYLVSVETEFEDEEEANVSEKFFSWDSFNQVLNKNSMPTMCKDELCITVINNENKRCNALCIKDKNTGVFISGDDIRRVFSLKSTMLDVVLEEDGVKFIVYGYGHGVGLSQNGASVMAEKGYRYEEILKKYYVGTNISKTIYKS